MAEFWRAPHPYQQNPGDQPVFWHQQQGPSVMRPPHPPLHPGTSLPPPTHPPELSLEELYNQLRTPQPVIQTLNHPPSTSLIRYRLSCPNPELVVGPSYTGTCPESLNPAANTSSQGGQTQMGPGQEADWTIVTPGPHYPPPPPPHQMPDPVQPQTPSTLQAPPQDGPPKPEGHKDMLPVCSPASSATTKGSADYSPGYSPTTPPPVKLHGAPETAQHLELTAELRNQLHLVPAVPFRRLVRSLPLNLRKRLRRVCHGTYAIRRGENKGMHKAHMHRHEQQVLDLRGQVRELTQARDTLQQQLNVYEATQEEVDALKDQLATYRRLRMPAHGVEGL
ncbi:hypothetical protein ABVT39_025765 [Epinephelus coioides]